MRSTADEVAANAVADMLALSTKQVWTVGIVLRRLSPVPVSDLCLKTVAVSGMPIEVFSDCIRALLDEGLITVTNLDPHSTEPMVATWTGPTTGEFPLPKFAAKMTKDFTDMYASLAKISSLLNQFHDTTNSESN